MSLNNLGTVADAQGDSARAIALCEEGLALRRELGHQQGIAESLYHLGLIVRAPGDGERAATLFAESVVLYQAMNATAHTAECLAELAALAGDRADGEAAARLCGAAIALHDSANAPMRPEMRAATDRAIAHGRALLGEDAFTMAEEEGRSMSPVAAIAEAVRIGSPSADMRKAATQTVATS